MTREDEGEARSPLMRGRGASIGNEFAINPMPLLSSTEEEADIATFSPSRTIGIVEGISLVVGMIVGSGIFSSPGNIVSLTGSAGASLLIWIVGGSLAWMGASCFAELGTALPVSGGPQAYLSYAYGPLTSFTFTFTSISIIKPSGAALIAIIFGEYVARFFYLLGSNEVLSSNDIPSWISRLVACFGVLLVSLINIISTRLLTRTQTVLMVIKIAAVLLVVVLGVIAAVRSPDQIFSPSKALEGTKVSPSSIALALYSSLWAFDGWDQSNYVAGEMKNVERNLPIVIHTSIPLTIIIFLLANIAYLIAIPVNLVAKSNTIALDLGDVVLGNVGSGLLTCLVAVSTLGALTSGSFTTSRLISSAASSNSEAGFLPQALGAFNKRTQTPVNAIVLQLVLTCVYIIIGGGFQSLVNFYSVAIWYFYLLCALSVIVLRMKEPDLHRPYKTWIAIPMIFSSVTIFLLCMPVFAAPLEAAAAFGFIALSVPVYFISNYIKFRKVDIVNHIPAIIRNKFKKTYKPLSSEMQEF
ncbi:amino acid transporter [Wallemia mellicola CBS 633.66]|uniref:Amino acid transporter n=2 Tax=Wallemia mellicola TaxID=1708541 RepID=A0A4T0NUG2_9BASI|nr:amino acid transporter [Wallemia mellicola CBS 633.66]TIB67990.1 hypothetical protein E3Q24_03833 [Wallemia mellicola]EIM22422.1 amino acid transporter [Wallemia mellicola CBS 633.66]TIB80091.1 amino acid transporter [Wallemia mellicola]TIB84015.1 amino acid transporter [Wallemia mellicola]TIC01025.1 amino acid transporter [Wallemia mellicola]|eukprot:XP_006957667.1 amino acid transporter [Wallemia mellicola CBS 633.66]